MSASGRKNCRKIILFFSLLGLLFVKNSPWTLKFTKLSRHFFLVHPYIDFTQKIFLCPKYSWKLDFLSQIYSNLLFRMIGGTAVLFAFGQEKHIFCQLIGVINGNINHWYIYFKLPDSTKLMAHYKLTNFDKQNFEKFSGTPKKTKNLQIW